MNAITMGWIAVAIYVLATGYLTYRGAKKTKDLSSYSVGSKDIPPIMVGLSLTAQLTSVATFVVNPGLIYKYGLSGMLGFGVAAALGITCGLFLFSKRFLRVGNTVSAITVPQWIGKKYDSKALRSIFAIISLALTAFGVLIIVALSLSLGQLLGISPYLDGAYNGAFTWLITAVVLFVFTYMMIGGANTHAYTNSIQGIIMLIVALILIGSGLHLFFKGDGLFTRLAAQDPNLVSVVNPASLYFRNIFEVFFCNFIVGLAIVCQPHIVSKVLYLKNEKQVKPYLMTAVVAGFVFALVMIVGFYARVQFPEIARADFVVPTYIAQTFSPILQVVITIGILCAGLSTLEGILLSLSTIFSTDIFMPLLSGKKEDAKVIMKKAMNYGKVLLIVIAGVMIYLSVSQVKNPIGGSVAIFGMYGVYLLFSTTFFPLAAGMFMPKIKRQSIISGVVASIILYLGTAYFKWTFMSNNPAFLATVAIIGGWVVVFALNPIFKKDSEPVPEAA